jgi:hypothetical protein
MQDCTCMHVQGQYINMESTAKAFYTAFIIAEASDCDTVYVCVTICIMKE